MGRLFLRTNVLKQSFPLREYVFWQISFTNANRSITQILPYRYTFIG